MAWIAPIFMQHVHHSLVVSILIKNMHFVRKPKNLQIECVVDSYVFLCVWVICKFFAVFKCVSECVLYILIYINNIVEVSRAPRMLRAVTVHDCRRFTARHNGHRTCTDASPDHRLVRVAQHWIYRIHFGQFFEQRNQIMQLGVAGVVEPRLYWNLRTCKIVIVNK